MPRDNAKPQLQPTGSYVLVGRLEDDERIQTGFCRVNTIPQEHDAPIESLCLVKRISRAKIFDSLAHAMEWKNAKNKHSDIVKHVELSVKELMI